MIILTMEICKYYQKGVYPGVYKIIAIGDIHGDLDAYIKCLFKAGVVDNNINWTGGKTHIVQLGDILDRKARAYDSGDEDSEFKIISIIAKLQVQSVKSGGAYHCIIGNHEIMNVMGNFDYVSPMGIKHFDGVIGRRRELAPGSQFSKYLSCFWNPIIKIGDWIFCHGGLNMFIARNFKIEEVNLLMREYLFGNVQLIKHPLFSKFFLNDDSLLWNRDYSGDNIDTSGLKKALSCYNAKHLVIGHTPQTGGINSKGNGMVWRVDSAMSNAFGRRQNNDRIQVLAIIRNGANVKII